MTRRRVTQADLADLRKRTPRPDLRPKVAVVVRRIIDPDPIRLGMLPLPTSPNTPEQDAAIAAAMVGFRLDGKVRRLIFDNRDPAEA
ncbi:hypothetical protein ABIF90_000164 [Bradyrhizobium japonicum]